MITKVVRDKDYPDQIWLVHFRHKGASANIAWLQDDRTLAHLYDVFSRNRGKGEASALIREIDRFCKSNRIFLEVRAEVYDTGTNGIQTNEELKNWYVKNGAFFIEYDEEDGLPLLALGYLGEN